MKQDFRETTSRLSYQLLLFLALCTALTMNTGCDEYDYPCVQNNTCVTDATAPDSPNEDEFTTKPRKNPPHASADATAQEEANNGEASNAAQLPAIRLTCASDGNLPLGFVMIYGTEEAQPVPLAQWEINAQSCAVWHLSRPSGHHYRLTMILPQRDVTLVEWMKNASIGNATPPHERILVHERETAQLYLATDLGMPKVYAIYKHSRFIYYIEWLYSNEINPELQLKNLLENHQVLEIPQDLRDLLRDIR